MPSQPARRRRLRAGGSAQATGAEGGRGGFAGSLMDNPFYKSSPAGRAPCRRRSSTCPRCTRRTQGVPRPLCPDPGGAGGLRPAARRRGAQAQDASRRCRSSPARSCARTFPRPMRDAAAHLPVGRARLRPHRPGNRDRRQGAAAPRRHRDPRRPAGVLPARRPGQGARQRAHQPRRQRLRRPAAGAEGRRLRGLLQRAALPVPAATTPTARPTGSTSSTTSARSSATPPTPPASASRARAGCPTGSCAPPASASTTRRRSARPAARVLSFMGVPILPVPALSFPLSTSASRACCRPPSAWTA